MPTYKNVSDRRITWREHEWMPGRSKSFRHFIPHLLPEFLGNLIMTSPEPYVLRENRDLDYVELLIEPGTPVVYWMPYWDSVQLTVHILLGDSIGLEVDCVPGEEVINKNLVRMYVGDSLVPIVVDHQNYHHSVYSWNKSAYLTFESDMPTVVTVKVDPFTTRGTDRRGGD